MKKQKYKNAINPTDIICLEQLSKKYAIDLRAKRDDLYPFVGGGNKCRKILRYVDYMLNQGFNAIVTNGGTQSNHARVTALAAARLGWPCRLILHGDPEVMQHPTGNLMLMTLAGAEIEIVSSIYFEEKLRQAVWDLQSSGFRPYQIPGGGHSVLGALAYVDAVNELKGQAEDWRPDVIVLASGTGSTQAGIIVGLETIGWECRVVGISIARKNPRGKDVVEQTCSELREHLRLNRTKRIPVIFRDNWVGSGYESADRNVYRAIKMAGELEGLILDPTYTGKAFSALLDLIANREIPRGSKVLFWHTGGIFNLMATDCIKEILQS